jgi:hypothetical protein
VDVAAAVAGDIHLPVFSLCPRTVRH